ncbi:O-antigen ligase family protein [Novosphingobium sp. 2638]|uniref:O-antigen ligase family protein n=1 Tax=Novosphingobium beihaiensis TaxID=2930389 RepID=A0ABT0BQZ2_9SPHN|nr:O-antigen ligase family protein [Novosphingobium beihaiensis]
MAFSVFAIVTALGGGSSRPDIYWLLFVRPVTVICLMAMLLSAKRLPWAEIQPLPLLFAAFAITIGIQLIPLPPALWHGIPGRAQYAAVAAALNGLHDWHPLSLAPDRTWNSLISLLVPFTAMVGFLILNDQQRRALLWPILGFVAFSMLLGLVQYAGGASSSFYWYSVSGRGQPIGLFANRNHQGAFLTLALPLLRVWALQAQESSSARKLRNIIGISAAAFIFVYILVLGSRAAMGLTIIGLLGAFLVQPSYGSGRLMTKRQRILIVVSLLIGVLLLTLAALNADRAETIMRIVHNNNFLETEGRVRALPTLLHIISQTFPFGTGFGSFVPVYASFEPDYLLKPTYFNNAHNDLIELTITGGLPSLLVLVAFLVWYGRAVYRSFTVSSPTSILQRAVAFSILILLLSSLGDYPLRTPFLGALFIVFTCWLAALQKKNLLENYR